MRRHHLYALLLTLLAPALMGPSCEEDVDLGGSPDAGTPPGDSSVPGADAGTVTPTTDGGPMADAGSVAPGDALPHAREMLIDVFDGTDSTLSTMFEVTFETTAPVTADVRAERLEILAADGSVDFTYPLGGAPLTPMDFEPDRSRHVYRAFLTSSPGTVGPQASGACGDDTFPSRLLWHGVRIVASVDGVEVPRVNLVDRGTGGFPPMRPFVLCHENVRVERTREGFRNGVLGFTMRPDGLYDVELWEDCCGAAYTASEPLVDIDPTVRVSPASARFWPSYYPTFDVAMDHIHCGPSGCTLNDAMFRYISGEGTVPMRMPITEELHWCAVPQPGDMHGGIPWPPSSPDDGFWWGCDHESGGDGEGIVRFSGTTASGRFAVELFVGGGVWRYAEPYDYL